jgi:GNAT superfamily N-acetyltransferase
MSYAIRIGVADDFAIVSAFLDEHLRQDYFIPSRQLREILDGRYHETILAIENEELVGLAIMTRRLRTLVNLLVAPCERKRGIGDALLSRLKVERIRAKLNVSDGDPTGYYRKRGYRDSPERTGKQHIKIMVVDLDDPPDWTRFATS